MQAEDSERWTEKSAFSTIHSFDMVAALANVQKTLHIYLSIFVINYTSKREFSKLKRIKNSLCSMTGQNHLALLTILSAEHKLFRKVSTQKIQSVTVQIKARRKI